MATGAQLKTESLAKEFRESGRVVEPLDLQIRSGEFVSFLGPSGCGKSTLLRIIAGLESADSGTLTIESFGQTYFKSFVFQDPALLPWRTALENVLLPLELIGCPRSESIGRARAALQRVALTDAASLFPSQLSGGMKMRCSLARALVASPTLLLLDEPFAALDENTRFHLQEDLRRLWRESKMTVIFVTHSVSEAAFIADRAIVFTKKPARVIADLKNGLPEERDRQTRASPGYLREIARIGEAFQ